MYMIVVRFDIKPEHRQDFINAGLQDGHDSCLYEPGTKRFEIVQDEDDPNCFYFSEVYEDKAANQAHGSGPYYKAFAATVSDYYRQQPVFLVKGTMIPSLETTEK
jgi:autoinducer 2-degrading protein